MITTAERLLSRLDRVDRRNAGMESHLTTVQLRQLAKRHNAFYFSTIGGQVWEITAHKGEAGEDSVVAIEYKSEKSHGRKPKATKFELMADNNFNFWKGLIVENHPLGGIEPSRIQKV